jgi:hypothetical protein
MRKPSRGQIKGMNNVKFVTRRGMKHWNVGEQQSLSKIKTENSSPTKNLKYIKSTSPLDSLKRKIDSWPTNLQMQVKNQVPT